MASKIAYPISSKGITRIPNYIFLSDKNTVRISLSHKNISTIDLIFNLVDITVYSFCSYVFH
ncbi:hypothetical protein AH332_10900 [Salmonella enterica subsp. salamae]|nr:hypothetical protein [Salmonella enterica subsp. salamae]